MANAIFPLYKQAILAASANSSLSVNDTTNGPYSALVQTSSGGYTYNSTDNFWSTVSANNIGVAGGVNLSAPSVAAGTFTAANITYSAVTGNQIGAIVIYRHNSGAATTWLLVCYIDTGVTGLPVTPNGGDITVTWNASGIFTL